MLTLLQDKPIVVEVFKQPPAAHDISFDVVVSIFMLAGAFLLAAAIGSVIVGGLILVYKRWREGDAPSSPHSHTRLGISGRL